MDETPPTPEPASELAPKPAAAVAVPPLARRTRLWPWLLLLALTFAAGVILTVWALPTIERWRGGQNIPTAQSPETVVGARTAAAIPASSRQAFGGQALAADAADMLEGRVVQLEQRLNRIAVEAQAASGNAGRAEGLLVAFAARRALDSGAPLGYVEGQLRLRFGQAQPRAVATIINAAREPITLGDLRVGLSDLAVDVTTTPAQNWWEAMQHEARELVTIRRTATPSPRPQAAFERALHYIDAGRIGAALTQVERMPGRAKADRWVQLARRYLEARRAIDLIETAAILEPRQLRTPDEMPIPQTPALAP